MTDDRPITQKFQVYVEDGYVVGRYLGLQYRLKTNATKLYSAQGQRLAGKVWSKLRQRASHKPELRDLIRRVENDPEFGPKD